MNGSEINYRHIIMARTARTCAFFAAITALLGTMIFPFILCGLSIIFATLSRGKNLKYQMSAKIALIVSCITLIGNTAYIGVVAYNLNYNTEYRQQLDETFEQIYGMNMEEYTSYMFSLPEEPVLEQ